MRIVFAGTPAFAARSLAALLAAGHAVVAVLTQPDRPAGRGLVPRASPVKALANDAGVPVHQPAGLRLGGRFDADARAAHALLAATPHDVMVVAAYGLILPPSILALPPAGCLNVHASLLPRWRGAAPVQRAIEAGDAETGITIMRMDAGLDTGDLLSSWTMAIGADDTADTLTTALAELGGRAIVDALERLAANALPATPQAQAGATYAAKLSKGEAPLDFARPTRVLVDRIRAFDPFPGSTAELIVGDGSATPFRLWHARALASSDGARAAPGAVIAADDCGIVVATADGSLAITELQKPGGRRLPAVAFLRDFDLSARLRFVPGVATSAP